MSREWRNHPRLQSRLHPEHPDDVQVTVHDGGPRVTNHRPELVWVTVVPCDGDVFRGFVLNKPEQLSSVSNGSEIQFLIPEGGEHPLMVTDKYLVERSDWIIEPCDQCGLSELFDAPSDLMRIVFPNNPPDAVVEMFSALCGACGGSQLVQHNDTEFEEENTEPPRGKWWQFWN